MADTDDTVLTHEGEDTEQAEQEDSEQQRAAKEAAVALLHTPPPLDY